MEAAKTPDGRAVLESELYQLLSTHNSRLWDIVLHQQHHAEVLRVRNHSVEKVTHGFLSMR